MEMLIIGLQRHRSLSRDSDPGVGEEVMNLSSYFSNDTKVEGVKGA